MNPLIFEEQKRKSFELNKETDKLLINEAVRKTGLTDESRKYVGDTLKKYSYRQSTIDSYDDLDKHMAVMASSLRESAIGSVMDEVRAYSDDRYYDYSKDFKKEDIDKAYEESTISERYKDRLYEAKNKEHLKYLIKNLERKSMEDEFADEKWGTKLAYDFIFAGLEVAPLSRASASFKATSDVLSSTNTRRFLAGGVGYEGLLETIKHNMGDKDRLAEESIISMLSAGVGNMFLGKPSAEFLFSKELEKDILERNLKETYGMSNEVVSKIDTLAKKGKIKDISEIVKGVVKDKKQAKTLVESIEQSYKNGNIGKDLYNSLRVDLGHMTATSDIDLIANFSKQHFYDSSFADMARDKTYIGMEADILKKELTSAFTKHTAELRKEFNEISNSMTSHSGILENLSHKKDELFDMVGRARRQIELGIGMKQGDTELGTKVLASEIQARYKNVSEEKALEFANKALKEMEAYAETTHKILARHREDFANGSIKANKDYNHIVYNRNASIANGLEHKTIIKLIDNAISSWLSKRGLPIDAEMTNKIASSFSAKMFGLKKGTAIDEAINEKELFDMLDTYIAEGKLPKELAEKAGGSMFRLPMDRSAKVIQDGRVITFLDLMENNIEAISEQYAREMSGWTALEKTVYKKEKIMNPETKKLEDIEHKLSNRGNVLDFLNMVENEINDKVAKNIITRDKGNAEMARMNHIINHYLGEPTSSMAGSETDKWIEALKNFTNFKLLGQVGFSMGAEVVNTISYIGVKNFFEASPQAKSMLKAFRTGKITDEEVQDIFDVFTVGDDFLRGIGSSRYDSTLTPEMSRQTYADMAVHYSEKMAQVTYLVSGMKPLTAFLQTVNALAMNKKVYQYAMTGKKDALLVRMQKDLNISDEKLNRIASQFNKSKTWYHGTDIKFDELSSKEHGKGVVFFTDTFEQADTYARSREKFNVKDIEPRVIKKDIVVNNTFDAHNKEHIDKLLSKINIEDEDIIAGLKAGDYKRLEEESVLDAIKELGYDSFYVTEMNDGSKWGSNIGIFDVENKYKKSKHSKWNFDDWDNDVLNEWQQSVKIMTDSLIQVGHLQDNIGVKSLFSNDLLQDTPLGRVALSLKMYMIQAYTKQLGRTINTMDANMALGLVAQGSVMSLLTMAQEYANYAGTDKLEEKLSPEKIVAKTIGKMTISSYIPSIVDTGAFMATGEALMGNRYNKPSDVFSSSIAPLAVIDDLIQIGTIPNSLISGNTAEATKTMTDLLPNWYGTQQFKNVINKSYEEEKKANRKSEQKQTDEIPLKALQ